MLNQDELQAIKAPFRLEALSSDTSRGFELTSIRGCGEPGMARTSWSG